MTPQNKNYLRKVGWLGYALMVALVILCLGYSVAIFNNGYEKDTRMKVEVKNDTAVRDVFPANNKLINLSETQQQKCLIYNKVPKCASSTLLKLMKNHLAAKLGYKTLSPELLGKPHLLYYYRKKNDMKAAVKQLSQICENKSIHHVIVQHQQFANFVEIAQEKTPFHTNLIRDPVDHYISVYYYRRHTKDGRLNLPSVPMHYRQEFLNSTYKMNFDDCVKTGHKECTHYNFTFTIIPFFCGTDDYCMKASEKSLNQAKRNVMAYYPVVGYLEAYIPYLELCEVIWPQFFEGAAVIAKKDWGKTNANIYRSLSEPSCEVKELMKTHLKIEYDFYRWVNKRFQYMYEFYMKRQLHSEFYQLSVSKMQCNFTE